MPSEVLAEADRMARELGRSRSWVVAEAVRRFAEPFPPDYAAGSKTPRRVREPTTVEYASAEVAAGRSRLIERNVRMSPADRLRQAQELVRLARTVHPRAVRDRIIAFHRLEDYLAWKKIDRAGG